MIIDLRCPDCNQILYGKGRQSVVTREKAVTKLKATCQHCGCMCEITKSNPGPGFGDEEVYYYAKD